MNISKLEQRVLHALAQGGSIRLERDAHGVVIALYCYTREGFILSDCTLAAFKKLKARGFIESKDHGPYRISYLGRRLVRAQFDNR